MGDPKSVGVNVTVDFTGISYDSGTGQWTVPANTPVFTVPNKTKVKAGDNTITWTLLPNTVPANFSASFPPTDGITFGEDWSFGDPSWVSATSYQVSDNFTAPPANTDYEYGINVVLTSLTDSTVSRTFPFDPEIQNEGSGGISIQP